MAAVWHTLTWYPEHSATLWGYKVALHLGDLVTGDGRGVFYRELVKCFQKKLFLFEVNPQVTSK